jgi:hypothetical protein
MEFQSIAAVIDSAYHPRETIRLICESAAFRQADALSVLAAAPIRVTR